MICCHTKLIYQTNTFWMNLWLKNLARAEAELLCLAHEFNDLSCGHGIKRGKHW